MAKMETTKGAYYVVQKDWRYAPEVWKGMLQIFVIGFIAGLILYAYLAGGGKASSPAPTVTVTVTSAP
jgi:hypothetical protein